MKTTYLLFISFLLIQCDTLPLNNKVYGTNSNSSSVSTSANEQKEFSTLMQRDPINKGPINAEVINYLLSEPDSNDKNTAAVFENTSRCDIIVRLTGVSNNKIYNLPVPKNNKNQFVIEKGKYTLKSNVCGAKYYSQKNIIQPLVLKLSN